MSLTPDTESSASSATSSTTTKLTLIISIDPSTNLLATLKIPHESLHKPTISTESQQSILNLFSRAKVHPDRLIYALAGILFRPESNFPFGGSKTQPGYAKFNGRNAEQLLDFIVTSAYKGFWMMKQEKILVSVVASVNRVLELHFSGEKDMVDELMMRGVKKAGHIDWFGAAFIPEHLKHVD
ncbi:hypothetical protein HDU98_005271, partial [Podochytrium sp. JEL0797]